MKMNKKVLCVGLMVVMLFSLAGCNINIAGLESGINNIKGQHY